MKRRLTTRDVDLLKRIVPHGHVTLEIAQRWYPQLSKTAAGSWIKRLRKTGYLESAPLDRHRHYYRLSNKSVLYLRRKRNLRVSRAATRPLKPYRKPEKYAFLVYTSAASEPMRTPFRPYLDATRFGDIAETVLAGKSDPLRQKLFYAAGTVVGYFVLDRGQQSFIKHKLKAKVFAVQRWKSFQHLTTEGNFRLTIVTTTASRKVELEELLTREPPPFPYEVIVLEDIAALLPTRVFNTGPRNDPQEAKQ